MYCSERCCCQTEPIAGIFSLSLAGSIYSYSNVVFVVSNQTRPGDSKHKQASHQ